MSHSTMCSTEFRILIKKFLSQQHGVRVRTKGCLPCSCCGCLLITQACCCERPMGVALREPRGTSTTVSIAGHCNKDKQ